VHTRRDSFILMTGLPLLATEAIAEEKTDKEKEDKDVSSLFDAAMADLRDPIKVQQNYRAMAFYVDVVVALFPKPDDVFAAQKTYQLLGESIAKTEGKFDQVSGNGILPALKEEYKRYRDGLFSILKLAGIEARSLASWIVQKSLVAMLLFYAVATGVKEIRDLARCVFPFCFKRLRPA
jgi:hypothetical protein